MEMFYDLNVPWSTDHAELQRTLSFLAELGYNVVALNHTITGKIQATPPCAIPDPLPFATPPNLRILRRCTINLSDVSQNHRIPQLASSYDLVAVRPTDERTLQQACQNLDIDLVSLDLTVRYPFHFKFKMLGSAVERGIRIELCYAPGLAGGNAIARRYLISNATALIRATRGRGLIISSEARSAIACRGPWDAINLANVWGLGSERGREALDKEARGVVVTSGLKRTSYRGVVNVINGGSEQVPQKRKAEENKKGAEEKVSKREMKRREKKAKLEVKQASKDISMDDTTES